MAAAGHHRYTNDELVDMVLIYGECGRNERQAAALYAQRFPDRRAPHHARFGELVARLRQHGALRAPAGPGRGRRRRNQQDVDAVQQHFLDEPHTSTRAAAADLGMSHSKVHRVLKHDLGMKPWKRHTSQKLHPGDDVRRIAFCDWIADEVSKI